MRFVTYSHRGAVRTGLLSSEHDIVDLTRALELHYQFAGRSNAGALASAISPPGDLRGFLEGGSRSLEDAAGALELRRAALVTGS